MRTIEPSTTKENRHNISWNLTNHFIRMFCVARYFFVCLRSPASYPFCLCFFSSFRMIFCPSELNDSANPKKIKPKPSSTYSANTHKKRTALSRTQSQVHVFEISVHCSAPYFSNKLFFFFRSIQIETFAWIYSRRLTYCWCIFRLLTQFACACICIWRKKKENRNLIVVIAIKYIHLQMV